MISSAGGWLNVTLRIEAGTWELPFGIRLRTRMYNNLAPSPVLVAHPGDRVRIRLQNMLGPDSPVSLAQDDSRLGFREANTTNLHLHGVYDDANHDNTFLRVHPGEVQLYQYQLHPMCGSSLIYYHPHAEGSTTLQNVGGMGGALVVVDGEQEARLRLGAESRVLLIQALVFDPASPDYVGRQLSNLGTSSLPSGLSNPGGFTGTLLLVNGKLAVGERLAGGSWLRLKLVNACVGGASSLRLGFDADSEGAASCRMSIMAYDGVWLTSPRDASSIVMPPGGRAEVMIGCTAAGTHTFGTLGSDEYGGLIGGGHGVVRLHVEQEAPMVPLPSTLPGPPQYYADLIKGSVEHHRLVEFSSPTGANVVNGLPYPHRPSYYTLLGSVEEWRLTSAEARGTFTKLHPYHQHMTHFQIAAVSTEGAGGLGLRVGDWRDTVPLFGGLNLTVRFRAPFVGLMMVHCHVLKHSESGMMTVVQIDRTPHEPLVPSVDLATREQERERTMRHTWWTGLRTPATSMAYDLGRMSAGRAGAHGPAPNVYLDSRSLAATN